MDCRINTEHDSASPRAILDFDYYYAMGTDGEVDEEELNQVQEALFNRAKTMVLWCFDENRGQRHLLPQDIVAIKDQNTQMARELGITAVSMGRDIAVPKCKSHFILKRQQSFR